LEERLSEKIAIKIPKRAAEIFIQTPLQRGWLEGSDSNRVRVRKGWDRYGTLDLNGGVHREVSGNYRVISGRYRLE